MAEPAPLVPVKPPGRLLVLRFGAVGDVVLTTPALQALGEAWPDTEIVYGVRRPFACLVEHDPYVRAVVPIDTGEGVWSYAQRVRALGCDQILDLHGQLRSRALRLMLGLPTVVWARRPWQQELSVRLGWSTFRAQGRFADRFHAAVEELVGRRLPRGRLRQVVPEAAQEAADGALRAVGLSPGEPWVCLTPGANWATKRWPIDRFAALAERIVQAGLAVVVTGSPDEQPLAQAICARVPAARDLTRGVPLSILGGLLQRSRALVANDSGPMHIARALGVPTVAIFGSTDPDQFDYGEAAAPTNTSHARIFAGVPCSPCHFYGRPSCPKGHLDCLNTIEVGEVWAALQPRLELGRVPPVSG